MVLVQNTIGSDKQTMVTLSSIEFGVFKRSYSLHLGLFSFLLSKLPKEFVLHILLNFAIGYEDNTN